MGEQISVGNQMSSHLGRMSEVESLPQDKVFNACCREADINLWSVKWIDEVKLLVVVVENKGPQGNGFLFREQVFSFFL